MPAREAVAPVMPSNDLMTTLRLCVPPESASSSVLRKDAIAGEKLDLLATAQGDLMRHLQSGPTRRAELAVAADFVTALCCCAKKTLGVADDKDESSALLTSSQ
jgi:hypothetical protein